MNKTATINDEDKGNKAWDWTFEVAEGWQASSVVLGTFGADTANRNPAQRPTLPDVTGADERGEIGEAARRMMADWLRSNPF